MITVREVISLLKDAKSVGLAWGGSCYALDTESDLEMEAFGDYFVSGISKGIEKDSYELKIAMKPVKAGAEL